MGDTLKCSPAGSQRAAQSCPFSYCQGFRASCHWCSFFCCLQACPALKAGCLGKEAAACGGGEARSGMNRAGLVCKGYLWPIESLGILLAHVEECHQLEILCFCHVSQLMISFPDCTQNLALSDLLTSASVTKLHTCGSGHSIHSIGLLYTPGRMLQHYFFPPHLF